MSEGTLLTRARCASTFISLLKFEASPRYVRKPQAGRPAAFSFLDGQCFMGTSFGARLMAMLGSAAGAALDPLRGWMQLLCAFGALRTQLCICRAARRHFASRRLGHRSRRGLPAAGTGARAFVRQKPGHVVLGHDEVPGPALQAKGGDPERARPEGLCAGLFARKT